MEFRSTNDNGYAHHQGDIVSNVSSGGPINSSHGVHLTGGSTGGIVQSAGDETNIALNIRAKGSGPLNIGSTTSGVTLNSSATQLGSASTTGIAILQRYRVDWTVPALSSAGVDIASGDSTVTVTGLTTNSILVIQRRGALNSTNSTGLFLTCCCSTVNELRLTVHNIGASTISGSTMSAYLLQVGF